MQCDSGRHVYAGLFCAALFLSYGYEQLTDSYSYDLERAVQILDEAGITDTDGDGYRELDGQNIHLNYLAYSSRNLDEFAQAVAISLEAIGIGCAVTVQDYDTALANQSAGSFDLITSNAIVVPTGDPSGFLGEFLFRKFRHLWIL